MSSHFSKYNQKLATINQQIDNALASIERYTEEKVVLIRSENKECYLNLENSLKTKLNDYKSGIIQLIEDERLKAVSEVSNHFKQINQKLSNTNQQIDNALASIERYTEEKVALIRHENKESYLNLENTLKLKLKDSKSEIKQLIEAERLKATSDAHQILEKLTYSHSETSNHFKHTNQSLVNIYQRIDSSLSLIGRFVDEKIVLIRKENKEIYWDLENKIQLKLNNSKAETTQIIKNECSQIKDILDTALKKKQKRVKTIYKKIFRRTE